MTPKPAVQNAKPKVKHTPTPWSVGERQDAAYIVRAVNAHEELLMCLKEIVNDIPRINKKEFYRQVVAKAEGK